MGRHDHIAGRPRNYISRRRWHKATHKLNRYRETVDEILRSIMERDD